MLTVLPLETTGGHAAGAAGSFLTDHCSVPKPWPHILLWSTARIVDTNFCIHQIDADYAAVADEPPKVNGLKQQRVISHSQDAALRVAWLLARCSLSGSPARECSHHAKHCWSVAREQSQPWRVSRQQLSTQPESVTCSFDDEISGKNKSHNSTKGTHCVTRRASRKHP